MYAIVEIAGKQYKVENDAHIVTDKLGGDAGEKVEFDHVLMYVDGSKVEVGTPVIAGAKVSATIEGDTRGKKVLVFKKKRRKGYRKTQGHRQQYTMLQIDKISLS